MGRSRFITMSSNYQPRSRSPFSSDKKPPCSPSKTDDVVSSFFVAEVGKPNLPTAWRVVMILLTCFCSCTHHHFRRSFTVAQSIHLHKNSWKSLVKCISSPDFPFRNSKSFLSGTPRCSENHDHFEHTYQQFQIRNSCHRN